MCIRDRLYCETVTNPLLEISDLPALAALAKKYGAVSIVDSTFATPISCNPIEHGFDLVIHSLTKMLNGHSDILGGTVAGKTKTINKIWEKLRNFGGSMDPHQASLVERGMKTLQIRYERSTETAAKLANWLEAHPKIKKVIYPGLKSHDDFELSKKILSDSGNMVSFVVNGGDDEGRKMLNNMSVASQAISLGGVESLISMPYATTHASWTQEARIAAGIDLGFIRFSTGLEDFEDLKNDFDQALSSL